MRKLIAITQISLDGVMQAPGGPEEDPRGGFALGGWAMSYWDDKLGRRLDEVVSGTYDLLLGRWTYEIFAAYWPFQSGPIADGFRRATKYVASRRAPELTWENSQALTGDAAEAVRQLKAGDGPDLHAWGSGDLLQTLIGADLVDEYLLWMCPLVLGHGRRLFEEGVPPRGLRLVEAEPAPSGVIVLRYRPEGPVPKSAPLPEPTEAELARRRRLAAEG